MTYEQNAWPNVHGNQISHFFAFLRRFLYTQKAESMEDTVTRDARLLRGLAMQRRWAQNIVRDNQLIARHHTTDAALRAANESFRAGGGTLQTTSARVAESVKVKLILNALESESRNDLARAIMYPVYKLRLFQLNFRITGLTASRGVLMQDLRNRTVGVFAFIGPLIGHFMPNVEPVFLKVTISNSYEITSAIIIEGESTGNLTLRDLTAGGTRRVYFIQPIGGQTWGIGVHWVTDRSATAWTTHNPVYTSGAHCVFREMRLLRSNR